MVLSNVKADIKYHSILQDSDLDTQLGGEKSVGAVSVGALSVGVQLVDEGDEDDGLFKAAIMQDENF
ncbi:predicted protein [Sclerotinia sclerotiorum 1980 UF-70]|uniref:Uncharacterized protein n=2 Tax=Sclerotinia sclerotiorum (strain ATCC 18683 / 1980 / Ss-1) TaxID=665079 RepID=A7EIQ4_SCLS1|nr:predicted protein [Sclerotinia sclerotiorum 1980 UF-70]APA11717.1 hypothetical protein sscle_08g064870 [Sclerotinia sclerotiorum 1980 UF-70]EDO02720.1 predicted protein [Sclerotinia sclerotiorum 1980 UF-70]